MVEISGSQSGWKSQSRGIRQGCPLSPYLFLLVMHALFNDVHSLISNRGQRLKRFNKVPFHEILYADDTILFSKDAKSVQKLLHAIEEISSAYGMALNKSKCAHIRMYNNTAIRFRDGMEVPEESKAPYLGCTLNKWARADQEIGERIGAVIAVWKNWSSFGKALTARRHLDFRYTSLLFRASYYMVWNRYSSQSSSRTRSTPSLSKAYDRFSRYPAHI